MTKLKALAKNKLLVRYTLMAVLAVAGLSLPPEAIDPIVSVLVGLVGE